MNFVLKSFSFDFPSTVHTNYLKRLFIWISGNLIESYSLRTKLFEHFAQVLHMVDSEGTDWLNKLQSVKDEEQQHNKSQKLN